MCFACAPCLVRRALFAVRCAPRDVRRAPAHSSFMSTRAWPARRNSGPHFFKFVFVFLMFLHHPENTSGNVYCWLMQPPKDRLCHNSRWSSICSATLFKSFGFQDRWPAARPLSDAWTLWTVNLNRITQVDAPNLPRLRIVGLCSPRRTKAYALSLSLSLSLSLALFSATHSRKMSH